MKGALSLNAPVAYKSAKVVRIKKIFLQSKFAIKVIFENEPFEFEIYCMCHKLNNYPAVVAWR